MAEKGQMEPRLVNYSVMFTFSPKTGGNVFSRNSHTTFYQVFYISSLTTACLVNAYSIYTIGKVGKLDSGTCNRPYYRSLFLGLCKKISKIDPTGQKQEIGKFVLGY